MMSTIQYIDEVDITGQRVLLRADFDVSLNPDFTIADDVRIQKNIPSITHLLKHHNRVICVAKLGRPKGRDPKYSLSVVVERLKQYLPNYEVTLVNDFTADRHLIQSQKEREVLVLENIRFYPEEKENNLEFAKQLATLADVYVNDAFAVSHREEASVVGITEFLPSYGGLLLKKEIEIISKALQEPEKPLVAIIGGAKVSTKLNVLGRLMEKADHLLIGGGLSNTFLKAQGFEIGESFIEEDQVENAKKLLSAAKEKNTKLVIPQDVVVSNGDEGHVVKVESIPKEGKAYDIGPETQAQFGAIIAQAKTIIWNGPVGYIEDANYRRGTDFIYYSIAQNKQAVSIVGGGDTLAAISKKEYLDSITHISTGGGAMLEFIEKGTLPGIEALKRKK
jgi:phosphoglycerate kinase